MLDNLVGVDVLDMFYLIRHSLHLFTLEYVYEELLKARLVLPQALLQVQQIARGSEFPRAFFRSSESAGDDGPCLGRASISENLTHPGIF